MTTSAPSLEFDAERVKRIRVMLGLSQQEFAAKLGVNINMINRWEQARAVPMRAPVLKALLDAEREAFGG